MPQIPQAIDYGGRPSLRTNRLDQQSDGNVRTADALVAAASEFKQVMDQKQAKEDRLNYALARNEIQQADLEQRAALSEDQDWESHDERYSSGFSTARDEILSRYNLSPSDKAIMSSESNLIHAQGRVSVGEGARRLEIDQGRARYEAGKAKARASLIGLDQPSRNNVVLGQLDVIDAQVEAGYMTEEQGQSERESMTQDFARASIDAMPNEEKIRVIEGSLRYRRGYGASLGQHSGAILNAAEDTGLPPELIAAVIQQESSGNAEAESEAGAVGLMQLKEDAAKEMGVEDRLDPGQNVQGGASYLAKQFARFDGDPAKALAAYNMGPAALQRVIDEYGEDGWLDRLRDKEAYPKQETANYVAKLAPAWIDSKEQIQTKGKYASGEGPLDADAIRNGEGTGSIADFLHADTAAKMLDQAYKGDKANQDRTAAYRVVDMAKNLYAEDEDAMMKYIRANTSGSVRGIAEAEGQQLIAENARALAASQAATFDDYAKRIEEGESLENIKAEDTDAWDDLKIGTQKVLEGAQKARDYGEKYAERTRIKDPEDGRMSLNEWNDMDDYGPGSKTDQWLESPIFADAFDEAGYLAIVEEVRLLKAMENADVGNLGQGPRGMVEEALVSSEFMGKTGRSDADEAVISRLTAALKKGIRAEQNLLKPPRELSPVEMDGVLNKLMSRKAYIDDWGFDDLYDVSTMTASQLNEAYLPIAQAKANKTAAGITIEDFLIQKARDKPELGGAGMTVAKIPEENIEKAYFALESGLGMDEVIRRLKGE